MSLVRYLQHWLSSTGTPLQVTDFVPQSDPIRGLSRVRVHVILNINTIVLNRSLSV